MRRSCKILWIEIEQDHNESFALDVPTTRRFNILFKEDTYDVKQLKLNRHN